jgi:hypothetical protein
MIPWDGAEKGELTPAQHLRKAAERIREAAGKATPGPWINYDDGDRIIRDPDVTAREDDSDPCGEGPPLEYVVDEPLSYPENGDQIALWDPINAVLVAEWLEQSADVADTAEKYQMALPGSLKHALALARAINAKGGQP